MMLNLKELGTFQIKEKLTFAQIMLLHFLYYIQTDLYYVQLMKEYIMTFGVKNENGKIALTTDEEKAQLVENGWLIKTDDKIGYAITTKFSDLFINKFEATNEFLLAYPGFTIINGTSIPIKSGNREELRDKYWTAIQQNKVEHQQVLLDIAYGKEKDLIKLNIRNFVDCHGWLDIRELRLLDNGTKVVDTFNGDY